MPERKQTTLPIPRGESTLQETVRHPRGTICALGPLSLVEEEQIGHMTHVPSPPPPRDSARNMRNTWGEKSDLGGDVKRLKTRTD